MAESAHERRRHDVGCPFCGLICDDLAIDTAADGLRVAANGCSLSRRGFEARMPPASPTIAGAPVDLAAAIGRAAEILGGARAPTFVVSADVAGTRAALRLADRLGGVVDHPDSDGLFRNLRVQQDAGAFATTLSEVRNRADLVLVVGPDPSPVAPRFFERCVAPQQTLLGSQPLGRVLYHLGPPMGADGDEPASAPLLPCAMEDLPRAVAALSALLRGKPPAWLDLPGLDPAALGALADALKAARYAVIVWAPALFASPAGELAAQALLEIVRTLNRTTRCSALALGGGGNLFGVNQVCLWQTGYPLRTSFGSGAPEHDPYRFAARRMIARTETDALVWVTAFAAASPPGGGEVPAIVLAPGLAADAPVPEVHIPVGVPGLDHAAQMFRTDVVVALQLGALRAGGLPAAGAVLAMIEARLNQGGTGR